MSDPMRSLSITVRLTPRQAVSALRVMEAAYTDDRALSIADRIADGLRKAGWQWDGESQQWRQSPLAAIPDPVL